MRFFLITILSCSLVLFYTGNAISAISPVQLAEEWSKPKFKEYTSINKTQQWSYTRKSATMIVSKTECNTCKPVTIRDVEEYNKNDNTALLLMHNQIPAMLRFYASPKGVNFRIFQIYSGGYYYEFQLGINRSASSQESFSLEQNFYTLINKTKF